VIFSSSDSLEMALAIVLRVRETESAWPWLETITAAKGIA